MLRNLPTMVKNKVTIDSTFQDHTFLSFSMEVLLKTKWDLGNHLKIRTLPIVSLSMHDWQRSTGTFDSIPPFACSLFLNIHIPPSFPEKRNFPVKVYIHGGYVTEIIEIFVVDNLIKMKQVPPVWISTFHIISVSVYCCWPFGDLGKYRISTICVRFLGKWKA
jgi:hypothetical protein